MMMDLPEIFVLFIALYLFAGGTALLGILAGVIYAFKHDAHGEVTLPIALSVVLTIAVFTVGGTMNIAVFCTVGILTLLYLNFAWARYGIYPLVSAYVPISNMLARVGLTGSIFIASVFVSYYLSRFVY